MEMEGTIKTIMFSGNNGFDIVTVQCKDKVWTMKGCFNHPNKGQAVHVKGIIETHSKYGKQIKANEIEFPAPKSEEGIIAYLSSGRFKGIGSKLAKRITDKFGDKTLDIINNSASQLLQVKGISQTTLNSIIEGHKESQAMFDIYNFTKGVLTLAQANKVYECYKQNAVKVLKENPYQVIYDIDGFGFVKADLIARRLGIDRMSQQRADAGITYVTQTYTSQKGHCYIKDTDLRATADSILYPIEFEYDPDYKKQSNIMQCVDYWDDPVTQDRMIRTLELTQKDLLVIDDYIKNKETRMILICDAILNEIDRGNLYMEEDNIYHQSLYQAEVNCSEIIAELLKKKPLRNFDKDVIRNKITLYEKANGFDLNEEQKEAVECALTHRFSVITGGPGRGKTTILDAVLSIWGNYHYVLCAPTGRAAQRMKESTGKDASTIHSLIEWNNGPALDNHIVFIDESSMLDILLASRTLDYFRDCQIVFIGDVKQLPSIGPGSVLKDLVDSKFVPTVFLKKCHRNQGSININSLLIDEGKKLAQLVQDDTFTFDQMTKDSILDKIISLYRDARKTYDEKDVCILCAQRERGHASVNAVNQKIREIFNSSAPNIKGCNFRVNDRIMQTKNHRDKEVMKDSKRTSGIYNGDCGKIIDYNEFDKIFTVEFDDGRIGKFTIEETEEFIFAWAITIHKSQGSEYPCVIIPHNFEHYSMLERNIFYTAVTRGSKECHLVGEAAAIDKAISSVSSKMRLSKLKQRIETALTN